METTTKTVGIRMAWSLDTGTHQTCAACGELKPYAAFRKRGKGEFKELLRDRCRECERAKRYAPR